MFCALIKFLEYFKDLKQLGRFTSSDISASVGRGWGGAKQNIVKTLLVHKTCLYVLGVLLIYLTGWGDAFKTNLLKKTLLSYASASI